MCDFLRHDSGNISREPKMRTLGTNREHRLAHLDKAPTSAESQATPTGAEFVKLNDVSRDLNSHFHFSFRETGVNSSSQEAMAMAGATASMASLSLRTSPFTEFNGLAAAAPSSFRPSVPLPSTRPGQSLSSSIAQ